jgi:hypothetical protein
MSGFTPVTDMIRLQLPDAIGVNELKVRNALADRGMAVAEGRNALAEREQAMREQEFQFSREQLDAARRDPALARIGSLAAQAMSSPNPREFVSAALANPAYGRFFAEAGIDPATIDVNAPNFESGLRAFASLAPQPSADALFNRETAERGRAASQAFESAQAARQHGYRMAEIGAQGKQNADADDARNRRANLRDTQSLRKEFESIDSVKNYKTTLALYDRATKAPNTRAGDLSVIYALGKMFDPTSVVREGELQLAKDAAPWLRKLVDSANSQLRGDGALGAQTRAAIMDALKGQVDAYAQPYKQERERYGTYATQYGFGAEDVVGPDPSAAFEAANPEGPQVGDVVDGYRFKGGDPSAAENWEKL